MHPDGSYRSLHFLSLGLAAACLAVGSLEFLPWLPLALLAYLLLLMAALHLAGQATLSELSANVLGLLIAGGAVAWLMLRPRLDPVLADLPLWSAALPYIGPVLMALLGVRLFRPRTPADFWLLQGLALIQVVLGCVLATNTLFGAALLAYVAAATCALAAHERYVRSANTGFVLEADPAPPPPGWLGPALGWGLATGGLALALFVLLPRSDQPDWDPLSHFGLAAWPTASRTGMSDEINLNRGGTITPDDTPAFWVEVHDGLGEPSDDMPSATRFRGFLLERYEDGIWRSELNYPHGGASPGDPAEAALAPSTRRYSYRVPRRTGGLFLAEPARPDLPVRMISPTHSAFHEAQGTVLFLQPLDHQEYRYAQHVSLESSLRRWPAIRLSENYLHRMLSGVPTGLEDYTRQVLAPSAAAEPALREGLARSPIDLPPSRWEKAAALLEHHLAGSRQFGYTLSPPPPAPDTDPTLDFLARSRQGACERFASALALMLRASGIPARVVKGYRQAERTGRGQYVVRQSAAHAWVEAVVLSRDGRGFEWLSLEPTPDADAPSGQGGLAEWLMAQQRGGQEFWRELIVHYNSQMRERLLEQLGETDWRAWGLRLGLAAALVLVVLVASRLLGRASPAIGLLERLQALLRQRGIVAERGETPAELVARAGPLLPGHVAAAPAEVVALHYRARFGGQSLGEEELRQASARLDALEDALRR